MNTNAQNRKLVIFDLNKTLVDQTSWYELNLALGLTDKEDEVLYRLGPEKESILTYAEWIATLVKIMKKRGQASRQRIEKAVLSYTLKKGAKDVIAELKKNDCVIAIVSGGFGIVVDDVAKKLGIEHAYSNAHIVYDNDQMLEDIVLTWEDIKYKPLMVESICRRLGFKPSETYYIADGDNDINIFKETISIAIESEKDAIEDWKKAAINSGEVFSDEDAKTFAKHKVRELKDILEIII